MKTTSFEMAFIIRVFYVTPVESFYRPQEPNTVVKRSLHEIIPCRTCNFK